MALNPRERILTLVVGSLLTFAAVLFGYNYVQSLFDERQTQIQNLDREISDKNAAVQRGTKANKKLAEWQHRSLPTDLVLARSLYKNWLAGLAERTRLAKADVTLGADVPKPGIYVKVPVSVRGQGTMEQVIQFLFDFYQADHLHYIRQLTLTPLAGNDAAPTPGTPGGQAGPPMPGGGPTGGPGRFAGRGGGGGPGGPGGLGRGGPRTDGPKYELVLAIEALSLPGGDRPDQLSDAKSDRLAYTEVDAYRKTITERNFFSPYQPVVENDPAADTYVTAVVKKEGKYQVWISLRSSGKMLKLYEGETFDLGKEKATISRIDRGTVEIEAGGRRREVALGNNLTLQRGPRGGFGRRGFGPPGGFPAQ
ncbi:MAG TPA: hypothetical protein VG125_20290 [Pirellulales bacterium]|jgi:hypothetical protein|nr:hypothetical protein [Pirellulales bacterium]